MIPLLFLLSSSVSAQPCNDVLVDDFQTAERKFFDNADRQINLMGGDYGADTEGSTFSISTTTRTLTFTPNAPNNGSFFFVKYDERACFDLRGYYAFQFDLLAPRNAYAEFTLTQTSPDCLRRVEPGDSVYIPLSRYYTTPGQWQTISMPFSDFGENVIGGRFDMQHLKDWTMVNMLPLGSPVQFRNMRLVGTCGPAVSTTTSTRAATTTSRQVASTNVVPPQVSSTTTTSYVTTAYLPPASVSPPSASPTSASPPSASPTSASPPSASPTSASQPTNNLQSGSLTSRPFVTGLLAGLLPAIYLVFF